MQRSTGFMLIFLLVFSVACLLACPEHREDRMCFRPVDGTPDEAICVTYRGLGALLTSFSSIARSKMICSIHFVCSHCFVKAHLQIGYGRGGSGLGPRIV